LSNTIEKLTRRVKKTKYGFIEIRNTADEVVAGKTVQESIRLARRLYASEIYQARVLATFILGRLAAKSNKSLGYLRMRVSKDKDWRVQETLAKAFDRCCADVGYKQALPMIREWLADSNPNVRRAVTEGLRIWTNRSYFRDHPETAVRFLSHLKDDDSEYVRRSVGNALRDISRKHGKIVKTELQKWDISRKSIRQTYRLASRFLR
jgi:3-methyladenine DNA glycosylase AlkD